MSRAHEGELQPRSVVKLLMRLQSVIVLALSSFSAAARAQETATLEVTVNSSIGQVMGYSSVETSTGIGKFTDDMGHLAVAVPFGTTRLKIKHLGYGAVDTTIAIPAGTERYKLS